MYTFGEDIYNIVEEPISEYGRKTAVPILIWNDTLVLQRLQRQGLPKMVFYKLKDLYDMTNADFGDILAVTWKSITNKNKDEIINGPSAFLALDLMALWDEGLSFFKDTEKLQSWLHSNNSFLENLTPFDMLDTPAGIERVRELIGRMKYGLVA